MDIRCIATHLVDIAMNAAYGSAALNKLIPYRSGFELYLTTDRLSVYAAFVSFQGLHK